MAKDGHEGLDDLLRNISDCYSGVYGLRFEARRCVGKRRLTTSRHNHFRSLWLPHRAPIPGVAWGRGSSTDASAH
jgi:hypothetical protein